MRKVTIAVMAIMAAAASGRDISSDADLISFMNEVNHGVTYSGQTVSLTQDIDMSKLSKLFTPIGVNYTNSFKGTFDGQGHVISHLQYRSNADANVGLFGYIDEGAHFRNVVLDSTCSFESFYANPSGFPCIGSFAGYAFGVSKEMTIEGVVNMANVLYTEGKGTCARLAVGGIVGYMYPIVPITVRNSVNYGTVYAVGASVSLGGIIGEAYSITGIVNMSNCANYGAVKYGWNQGMRLNFGGIVGASWGNTKINNVVGTGAFDINCDKAVVGAVVGAITSNRDRAIIRSAFWAAGGKYDVAVGQLSVAPPAIVDTASFNEELALTTKVLGTGDLVVALNKASEVKWSKVKYVLSGKTKNVAAFSKNLGPIYEGEGLVCSLYRNAAHTEPYDPSKVTSLDGMIVYQFCEKP